MVVEYSYPFNKYYKWIGRNIFQVSKLEWSWVRLFVSYLCIRIWKNLNGHTLDLLPLLRRIRSWANNQIFDFFELFASISNIHFTNRLIPWTCIHISIEHDCKRLTFLIAFRWSCSIFINSLIFDAHPSQFLEVTFTKSLNKLILKWYKKFVCNLCIVHCWLFDNLIDSLWIFHRS